jgi:lauroyl/myristoyl acyltransferase
MADIFNDLHNCPVKFFEKPCNASLFPLRLAKIANSSLVSVVPALQNNIVNVYRGPEFLFNDHKSDPGKIMQSLLSFFEIQIKKDPSVWSGYVRGSLANEI